MAAWQPLGVDGRTWEAFAFVYNGEATTADTVFDRLIHRGYARGDYATALDDLCRRGWLEQAEGPEKTHHVTSAGRAVREAAEERTDHYFYAPWACLSEPEKQELQDLLIRFKDCLNAQRT